MHKPLAQARHRLIRRNSSAMDQTILSMVTMCLKLAGTAPVGISGATDCSEGRCLAGVHSTDSCPLSEISWNRLKRPQKALKCPAKAFKRRINRLDFKLLLPPLVTEKIRSNALERPLPVGKTSSCALWGGRSSGENVVD